MIVVLLSKLARGPQLFVLRGLYSFSFPVMYLLGLALVICGNCTKLLSVLPLPFILLFY